MNLQVDRRSAIPVYEQVCTEIEKQIREGALVEGSRLPTERVLALELGVARNTIKQAYAELCQRGFVKTHKGSGSYVHNIAQEKTSQEMEEIVAGAVRQLRNRNLSQRDMEQLLREGAWKNLPKEEKIQLAWVDCSPEILNGTAKELEDFCNVIVTAFSLDEVREKPGILLEHHFDIVATTINHYEEIRDGIQSRRQEEIMPSMEMVVLSVSTQTISEIARIQAKTHLAVVFDSEWYRYSVECYLNEFGADCACDYVELNQAMEKLFEQKGRYQIIMLPPDERYKDGLVGEVKRRCMKEQVESFAFEQLVDQGSLLHMKKQAQAKWIK